MDAAVDPQARVADFVESHDLETPVAYRLLDAVAELGEVAAEVCASTDYGAEPDAACVPVDELGDAVFALLALCEELDVEAAEALETSLAKYEARIEETGDADSGMS